MAVRSRVGRGGRVARGRIQGQRPSRRVHLCESR